jgi:hypothetical protein
MTDLEARVAELELAVLALATAEFSDSPGHPFRGNQYTSGGGTGVDVNGVIPADHPSNNPDNWKDAGKKAAEGSARARAASALGGGFDARPKGVSAAQHAAGADAVVAMVKDAKKGDPIEARYKDAAKEMFMIFKEDPDATVEMVHATAQEQYRDEAEHALEYDVNYSGDEAGDMLNYADALDAVAAEYAGAAEIKVDF